MKAIVSLSLVLAAFVVGDPAASTVTVRAGEDLQQVLNAARPGDTILLERGATFVGNFTLPARVGDDNRDITVRTAGDEGLPAEGERISPDAAPILAKLRSPNNLPALQTAAGTRNWRIALIEFQANRTSGGDIIALGDGTNAQNALARIPSQLTLDRLYIHGDPERGQKRGISLNSSQTTILGCYIADIKALGQESHAIGAWNGPGGYLIENNYLEAAGVNLMIGGDDPSIIGLTPANIVVRGNTISKSLAWRQAGSPRWEVKNLFELKNARAVVVERNVFERSWPQAQSGYAIVFTVRNQYGGCGWCQVEDVRFRRNIVRDVAAGVVVLGTDPVHASRQTNGIRIDHNLFERIDRRTWGGDGYLMLLTDSPRDIVVDHNTVIQRASGGVVKIANGVVDGFVFTNNITSHGDYGFIGRDRTFGNETIRVYMPGAQIQGNVIAGGNASRYPPGNLFPSAAEFERQFVEFDRGDYRLVPSSPWRKAGTDGKDIGAEIGADLEVPPTDIKPRQRP